jgi:hypothetical protein
MAGSGFRLPDELEQLHLMERFERAVEDRTPVTISFFEHKRDEYGRPMNFSDGRPLLIKTTRTVEPYEAAQFAAAGHPYIRVVDRGSSGRGKTAYRTIRLDRVAVSRATGRPLMTAHPSDRYIVPNPKLDELATA